MEIIIPKPTIKRLSIYYRILWESSSAGYIRSQELSEISGFKDSQIRRDLAYFGQFGIPGKGYSVRELKESMARLLGLNIAWNVGLVGVGNLGTALLKYKGFSQQGFSIVSAFDVDRSKIGKIKNGIMVYPLNQFKKIAQSKNIKIVIITAPGNFAQEIADLVAGAGIKGLLNFAPVKLKVPEGVSLLNIDMSIELSRLSYLVMKQKKRHL